MESERKTFNYIFIQIPADDVMGFNNNLVGKVLFFY